MSGKYTDEDKRAMDELLAQPVPSPILQFQGLEARLAFFEKQAHDLTLLLATVVQHFGHGSGQVKLPYAAEARLPPEWRLHIQPRPDENCTVVRIEEPRRVITLSGAAEDGE